MMSVTNIPVSFSSYALETAIYLLNRIPSTSVPKMSYKIWKGKKLNLKYVNIWSFLAYVKCLDNDKLRSRSDKY